MTQDISQIKMALHKLEKTYYKMEFRNRQSLINLLEMYKTVEKYRQSIIEDFPAFSPDPLNKVIINNLIRVLENDKAPKDILEWTFFHYNDLFIFRINDLLISIDLELV